MDFLKEAWNGPAKYVIIFIAAIIIFYIPGAIIYMNKKKKAAGNYLQQNPTAAKVFMKHGAGRLSILGVNGTAPHTFYEKSRSGFFLLPGESQVELQFQWTRPGVMYRSVTTTVGPNTIILTAEANKTYTVSYDKKAETYAFVEGNGK